MPQLFHLEHEQNYISALLKRPLLRADTSHLTDKDFSPNHRSIIQTFDACLAKGGDVNRFIVADAMKAIGAKVADGQVEVGPYLEALELREVNEAAAVEIAKQIKTTTVRRELYHTGQEISAKALVSHHSDGESKSAIEIVGEAQESFNRKVNLLGGDDAEPKDAYHVDAFIDQASSFDHRGIEMPFRLYTDFYGQMDPAGLYAVAARLKVGKSTWLQSLLHQIATLDDRDEFRVLILDTELTLDQWQSRLIASITGIKEWYIRRKIYKKDREMSEKVARARELIKDMQGKVFHVFIGASDLKQQESIARRWYYKHVHGTNRRGMIAVDYFKPTVGGDFDGKTPYFLNFGNRVNQYKNLAIELEIPVYALVQVNREGEDTKSGGRMSNSTVVSGGDMLGQFCSSLHLLERLSNDFKAQWGLLGDDAPTHALKPLATRQLGPNSTGLDNLVKYDEIVHGKPVTRYCDNYLMYRFRGFVVSEWGSFKEVVERNRIIGISAKLQPASEVPEGKTLDS